jgi:AraC-like DNA-binding protein
MSDTTTTELGMAVAVKPLLPSGWSGGEHSGERLPESERQRILELYAQNWSAKKIAEETKHSRNTIAAILATPDNAARLRETRAARHLVAEDLLMRDRDDLLETLSKSGKLKLSDINSALMIGGIAIKDAGGAAPMRIEVSVEHEFKAAAKLMAGSTVHVAAPFAPVPPVIEAELILSTDQA